MSYYLLGCSPKLGSLVSAVAWEVFRNDPNDGAIPKRVSKRTVEFRDCWEYVLDSLVRGDSYLDNVGIDLDLLWDNIDHEELQELLNVGLICKLELVEHGYFSATLAETPSNAVEFRCA
jgi:hypothetical protein